MPQELIETLPKKEAALVKAGATREVAYKTLVSALDANTMSIDKFGDEHYTPDHSTRIRAAELISKLNGDLKADVSVENKVVNISGVSDTVVSALTDMVSDVSRQLYELRAQGRQTGEIIDVYPQGSVV